MEKVPPQVLSLRHFDPKLGTRLAAGQGAERAPQLFLRPQDAKSGLCDVDPLGEAAQMVLPIPVLGDIASLFKCAYLSSSVI